MKDLITIGLAQMHCAPNREENLEKSFKAVKDLATKGAQIICFPELFLGPYFCQEKNEKYFSLAHRVPGPDTEAFSAAAKQFKVVILASVYEQDVTGKRYNTVAVIDRDGSILGKYRKMHVPNDPTYGYDETFYFSQGDFEWRDKRSEAEQPFERLRSEGLRGGNFGTNFCREERSPHCGFQVFDTAYGKVAPMVCYDQWFPEGARICGVKGAQFIFYPTAIGFPKVARPAVRSAGAAGGGSEAKDYEAEISEQISASESAVPIEKKQRSADGFSYDYDKAEHEAWQVTMRSHAIDNHCFVAAVNRVQQEEGKGLNFWGTSFVCDPYGVVISKASSSEEENIIAECRMSLIEDKKRDWPFFPERRIKVEDI